MFIIEWNYQGGWELDESMEEAAIRETMEEAGVLGEVGVSIITGHGCIFSSYYFRKSCKYVIL